MTDIKTADSLTRESFAALRAGEICAILFSDLISSAECARAALAVRALTARSSYRWSNDLSIIGVSIGEAHDSDEALERYLAEGEQTSRIVRDVVFGGVSPIDRITLQMLPIWEPGIRVPSRDGRGFLQQVVRRWKQGGGASAHLDLSNTPLLRPFNIRQRFGLNVYIEMPIEGGAVEFWRRSFTEEEYLSLRQAPPAYGLSRDVVGEPDLRIRPAAGQAIIFDASRPHAVEPVAGRGERITNASFLGYAGDDAPLFQFA
ncbi:hypothetical protein GCM10009087_30240 [Sphingomonas oligophenolica]|uniref:2OG-Fe(II) oxygenase n=1 Tax=Sphingomonas oligophenolica TaxID=301154 RepID=A0ABU9Y6H0_9SPHN